MKNIPYGKHYITNDDINAVVKILRSDWITQGPTIRKFEEKVTSYCGAKYAVAVSSGTAALHISCLAAELQPGDEVITSPLTFAASANCILYCGGHPVFVDIQEDTANIDHNRIKEAITKRTKAIIPVHFAGHPCELEEIQQYAKKHGLLVIEDAAHALGAEYKGIRVGSCKYSDMAILSFHPVKHITTGEGGAVLTNRKDIYNRLLMLRNHGITKEVKQCQRYDGPWYYEMQLLGFNYRITDFQCALGISQLKKLGIFINRRREIVETYRNELSKINKIELPVERKDVKSAWHLYPIRLKGISKSTNIAATRRNIFNYFRKKNVGVQVHYIPVYLHPYYRRLGYKKGSCPIAEDYYSRVITLPLYPAMKRGDVKYVAKILSDALKKFK